MKKTINIHKDDELSLFYVNLVDHIRWLNDLLSKIPEDHRKSAKISIEPSSKEDLLEIYIDYEEQVE